VLKILSHCENKTTLDLGVMEIERLCPKFNGLTTKKIEMWRVNEGKLINKRGPKVIHEFEQDIWAKLIICKLENIEKETESGVVMCIDLILKPEALKRGEEDA